MKGVAGASNLRKGSGLLGAADVRVSGLRAFELGPDWSQHNPGTLVPVFFFDFRHIA